MGRFDLRTRTGQISAIIQTQAGTSFDPDAQAYFDRVTTAGGTLTTTEKDAVNELVLSLKTNSLWTLMKAIYPMVGASAAACAQNLKNSLFNGTFSSGWTFTNTGATPNGFAYMETSFNVRNETTGFSQHVSMYSRTQNISVSGMQVGAYDGTAELNLYQHYASVSLKGGSAYVYPSTAVTINNTNTLGLQIVSRTSNVSLKLYFNGSLLNTNTTAESATRPDRTVYIGASNWGFPNQYTPHENAFTSIGDGLTDQQSSDLYTAVQAFQTTLSRNV